MWYLAGLAWLALVIGVFWVYRRKREKRRSDRIRELDTLMSEIRGTSGLARTNVDGGPAQSAVVDRAAALLSAAKMGIEPAVPAGRPGGAPLTQPVPVSAQPRLARKPRLLAQPASLLYFIFRTGLPDHEVFANLTLDDVVDLDAETPAYEREQKHRRLRQYRLDLVICSKQLEIIAAVMMDSAGVAGDQLVEHARFVEDCLQAAQIRLVRLPAQALPRHQQVRSLVYGAGS